MNQVSTHAEHAAVELSNPTPNFLRYRKKLTIRKA
jgi:hypothetical protein